MIWMFSIAVTDFMPIAGLELTVHIGGTHITLDS